MKVAAALWSHTLTHLGPVARMGLIVSVFGSGADWSVSTLLLFTAVFILTTYYVRNRRPANFPPGPWTLPVVGNMHNLDHHRMHLNFMQVDQQRGGRIYFPSDVFVAFFSMSLHSWLKPMEMCSAYSWARNGWWCSMGRPC